MRIERLSTENLREGIFCARGRKHGEEMYVQLEAWLKGELLRGQIARAEDGEVAGFILYYPIEDAPLDFDGEGVYVVQCLFVKPKFQNGGIGKALIETALADAKAAGGTGIAAEGFHPHDGPDSGVMPGGFFGHVGMTPGESRGSGTLYYVSFNNASDPPRYLAPEEIEIPRATPRLKIDVLDCRRCHLAIDKRDLIEAVIDGVGAEKIDLEVHDTTSRETILDKGMSSGVFIDGKLTFFGMPLTEEDVWRAIEVAMSAREQATDR